MDEVRLPRRDRTEENQWVTGFLEAAPEAIEEAARLALEQKRVQLAARLVGLLKETGDPDLERVRHLGGLQLLKGRDLVQAQEDVEVLLERLRKKRLARAKARHRKRVKPPGGSGPRRR
jgi:hypothetical protein